MLNVSLWDRANPTKENATLYKLKNYETGVYTNIQIPIQ